MKNIIVDINAKMDIDNELMNPKYAFNKNKCSIALHQAQENFVPIKIA